MGFSINKIIVSVALIVLTTLLLVSCASAENGKLTIHSEGVNGEPLDSWVTVRDQSTNNQVASGYTGTDGVISFYLASGTYKAYISEDNRILIEDLVVVGGIETDTTALFGKLTIHSEGANGEPLDSWVSVRDQSTNNHVASGYTGTEGVISFYLAPGTYKAYISEDNRILIEDLVVVGGIETDSTALFGKLTIHSEGANGEPLDSWVSVRDQSTNNHVASGYTGTEGVISFYLAPGTYKAYISEDNRILIEDLVVVGGIETDITALFGKLTIHSEGANGEPLDSWVSVRDQSTNNHVASGYTGTDGVISFYLAPGTYKAYISEDNPIWIENLVVVGGSETGSRTDTSGPLLVFSNPANGDVNIPVTQRTVSFTFNEAMQSSISITWWGVSEEMVSNIASIEWSSDQKTISFTFDRNLPANTIISWALNPSTHEPGFKDLAGNPLPADTYSGSFTTESLLNELPIASFTFLPATPKIGDIITLNASDSYDQDGGSIVYEWDFESDGIVDNNGVQVQHDYNIAGIYTVTLTVTDDEGTQNSISKEIEVDDGDGLSWEEELKFGTDPTLKDSDDDGLNDSVEINLALDYLPSLKFNLSESHYPIAIEDFLRESQIYGYDPNETQWEEIVGTGLILFDNEWINRLDNWKESMTYSDYSLDLIDGESSSFKNLSVYVNVNTTDYRNEDLIVIQYWYLYSYNPKGYFEAGWEHEGDWEHITVFIENNTNNPKYISFSQHYYYDIYRWNAEGLIFENQDHPVIYVAEYSHASYPKSDSTILPLSIDNHYGTGLNVPWTTFQNNLTLLSNQPWTRYYDYWGGTNGSISDSPKSPWGRNNFIDPSKELEGRIKKIKVYSPVLLHAVDQYGRHIGIDEVTNEMEMEIPESTYSGPDAHPQWIEIFDDDLDITFYTTGIETGTFTLNIEMIEGLNREVFEFENVPTTISTIAYLSCATPCRLEIDEDGDGNIERYFYSTNTILTPAFTEIHPGTLNLKSNGDWITGYIELPGFDVNYINISTINLLTPSRDCIWVDPQTPATIGDFDGDSEPDLMVKFSRDALANIFETSDVDGETGIDQQVELTITGELLDGTVFEGTYPIRIIKNGK